MYHVPNVLPATSKGALLALVVDSDEERFAADILPAVEAGLGLACLVVALGLAGLPTLVLAGLPTLVLAGLVLVGLVLVVLTHCNG